MAHDAVVNGIYYNLDTTNKTAEVTYKGNYYFSEEEYSGSVVIPSSITYNSEIYSVTSIDSFAFHGCRRLTSVAIGNSVTSIGQSAFRDCSGLTSITIGNSVTSIGQSAFRGCSGLTSITIPNSVTSIGQSVFSGCSGLASITIGNSVTSIGHEAFYGCSGLTSITIPNSVTSIGLEAFYGCSGLTFITIGNGVTLIDNSAFYGCSGLTSITIPNSVTSIGIDAFRGCSGLTSITIGNSVTWIGSLAFYNCSSLTSVSIGESVKEIGNYAFVGCDKLEEVTAYPTAVPDVDKNPFSNYDAYLYVPCASKADYELDDIFGNFQYIECLTGEGGDENQGGDEGGDTPENPDIPVNPTPDPDPDPDPEPEPTPGGEITLYYVNKTDWSAVNAYVWDFATDTPIVAWSGEPATKLDKTVDGYEVYSYTFDYSLADRIIFNNGNGGAGNQTDNLTFEASKPYFYDGVWYETLTFDTNGGGTVDPTPDPEPDSTPDPEPDPEPEPEPDPTVPAFVVAGNGGSDITDIWCNGIEWDGTAEANRMKDADKDGIFEITYSNVPAGTWSFKVVVNTAPLQWLGGDFLDKVNSSAGYTIQNGGNIGFSLSNAADVTIKIDSADGKITLTTPSGNFGKVKIDYFSVANSDECLVENRFTAANNNTLKYTENIQFLEGNKYGYAGYRILGNCNYAVYEKNLRVEVTEAGIYDITIVFNGDYENPDFTITAVKQGGTTVSVEEVSAIMIYAKEGTIYSEVDFEIYDLAGVNVTKLNGSLQGVYIVKTAEGNRLISVW